MASVHKRKKRSPYWYGAYRTADGKVKFKSTGVSVTEPESVALHVCTGWETAEIEKARRALPEKREQAKAVSAELEKVSDAGRKGRLTESLALEAMSAIYQQYGHGRMPDLTVRKHFDCWLDGKSVAGATRVLYRRVADAFLAHLAERADNWVGLVTKHDAESFRLAQITRPKTVRKTMRILRGAFQYAVDNDQIASNPVKKDKRGTKKENGPTRRAFTMDEFERILGACDGEWRGLVLFGYYTGQRLNDIRLLKWSAIDLVKQRVHFHTQKTGDDLVRKLHPVLADWLEKSLPSSDNAEAFVFPRAATIKHVGTVSNYFADILTKAGLRDAREHPKFKAEGSPGKNGKHKTGLPCFHMLRHSFATHCKDLGGSDKTVADATGHSVLVSTTTYVHPNQAAIDDLIMKLPDITKQQKGNTGK